MNAFNESQMTEQAKNYQLPTIDLLNDFEQDHSGVTEDELIAKKDRILKVLTEHEIGVDRINATVGPTVTLFEIVPGRGVKLSKIKNVCDDIELSLATIGVRFIVPIPGRGTFGIEVPNRKPQTVSLRSVLASRRFRESDYELPVAIGKAFDNEPIIFDLTKSPHLLIAGAAGQGKTVAINTILMSLLYRKTPKQLKFVLIAPQKTELSPYRSLGNQFFAKALRVGGGIITDTPSAVATLQSLTFEMDKRYDKLINTSCRNIKEYNAKSVSGQLDVDRGYSYMPYIVVVIDEFADLIMSAGKEIELPIARLAQLARCVGIHLIVATQRPTNNVITGLIKANFPARIAFKVLSQIDSRTILDASGAEQLIGRGDMLISIGADATRAQCAFAEMNEIESVTNFISQQQCSKTVFLLPTKMRSIEPEDDYDTTRLDSLFQEAARVIVVNQKGSTALIQRSFSLGYKRAGRIMDQLEAAGIVGPYQGDKAREVLIDNELGLKKVFEKLGIDNSQGNSKSTLTENPTSMRDSYFEKAARIVVIAQRCYSALIQHAFAVGYTRACRIIDQLEAEGIVGASDNGTDRKVLIADENELDALLEKLTE